MNKSNLMVTNECQSDNPKECPLLVNILVNMYMSIHVDICVDNHVKVHVGKHLYDSCKKVMVT